MRKDYAKLQAREEIPAQKPAYYSEDGESDAVPAHEPNLELHPDRVQMLADPSPERETRQEQGTGPRRKRQPRSQPFSKEEEIGRQKKEKIEAQRIAREQAEKERAKKLAERERFRKAMAKARHGGPNGQRKLGRESIVLLEKARRLTGKS